MQGAGSAYDTVDEKMDVDSMKKSQKPPGLVERVVAFRDSGVGFDVEFVV
ncbi:unnamed protein product, partial [Gongylonema pulchrum]|uniref:Uncharacterized protein n=1 Tax=Gongylonema pulchrum TaxID=637853 RepID=A0A183DLH9_9BILA